MWKVYLTSASNDWAKAYLKKIYLTNMQAIWCHKFDQFWLILPDFLPFIPFDFDSFRPLKLWNSSRYRETVNGDLYDF